MDLSKRPATASEVLLHLIACELRARGLIVPSDVGSEEAFLDAVIAFRRSTPLFDLPHVRPEAIPDSTKVAVFGVCSSLGSRHPGSEEGPNILRRMSKRFSWRGKSASGAFVTSTGERPLHNLAAVDLGDLDFSRRDFDFWCESLSRMVRVLPETVIPLMIGGDHSFTQPVVKELVNKSVRPVTVVQLDQHLDVQLEGEFRHGRPVRRVPMTHANMISAIRELRDDVRIVQIGVDHFQSVDHRYVDDVVSYLDFIGPRVSDLEASKMPVETITSLIPDGTDVYLSIDVDVIERAAMLTTGIPSDFGLPFGRLLDVVKMICEKHRIIGVDIMEFGVIEAQRGPQTYSDAYRVLLLLVQLLSDLARHKC
ncbi:arginase family protein [Burkholderia glumae]|uniref:arginase family protein n=1 Tax=Burkholderia glumae TaxID=337 RepID=UPI003B9C1456